ncbi:FecCD family ABC transporter permease [Gulosibacter faecalis]|uniref:FecCD family ABC transporter permease n=1 Tax=Gulosibacter faecalis TaxID=272240 RepID=A0ABW5UWR4_9MICO|nr:iron chelate uptake ABC transporter family permease subunit [Gulosibacter faecalis]
MTRELVATPRVITTRTRWWSARIRVRWLAVTAALFGLAPVLATASLALGSYGLTLPDVAAVLAGGGERFHRIIVLDWRLPFALAGVVFGALLGMSGAVFQSITRNPLGSPDVIGFDTGAYTAVVVTMLCFGAGGYWVLAFAATAGGLGTALVVYLLARRHGLQGFRLIIVGIAVSALLGSGNAYLVTRADIADAMTVGFWAAGSLSRVTWGALIPTLIFAAAIAVAAAALAPRLRQLELGDEFAATLGVNPGRARLSLIVVGVACSAIVTAAAGPISFVALAAPQLALRLTRSPGVSLLGAAGMGAALLAAAHVASLIVEQLFAPVPVGLITVSIGGAYLAWLLAREHRRLTAA